jgi:hypothetical protein
MRRPALKLSSRAWRPPPGDGDDRYLATETIDYPRPNFRAFAAISACGPSSAGTSIRRRRWPDKSGLLEVVMTDNRARNGTLGAILGALIAVAFAVFLLNGGEHVGKKTVKSDADLPPVATGQPR